MPKFPSLMELAEAAVKSAIANAPSRRWRGYLRGILIESDLNNIGFTYVKDIMLMYRDRENWGNDFFGFMCHLMNMTYYGHIKRSEYDLISMIVWTLQCKFGKDEAAYYTVLDGTTLLADLKPEVMRVISDHDAAAAANLQERIEKYDKKHIIVYLFGCEPKGIQNYIVQ